MSNKEQNNREQKKMRKSLLSETMALSMNPHKFFSGKDLVAIEIVEISRSYYLYYMTAELIEKTDGKTRPHTYRFTFIKEYGGFKLEGFEEVT
ncbi:hypothetical protein [Halobacillus litoralis]|uniref:hypothetical protein n=1 Tax=Halobacillus litoralis TaxID=45668 RepID=UPI001CFD28C0|nr:hypothetical protein [Halobacillus litoralis]